MRAEGHAVESICRVLREQGCQVAARTYRAWRRAGRPAAARTVSDAVVIDALLATAGHPGRALRAAEDDRLPAPAAGWRWRTAPSTG